MLTVAYRECDKAKPEAISLTYVGQDVHAIYRAARGHHTSCKVTNITENVGLDHIHLVFKASLLPVFLN